MEEVRSFEALTPRLSSAQDAFKNGEIGPDQLRLLGFHFIYVRQNSLQFIATTEVIAEVNPWGAVQRVNQNCSLTLGLSAANRVNLGL